MTSEGSSRRPEDAPRRLSARITGRVQGVFFRASTERRARELGLGGWVRNRRDGSVELIAEGSPTECERLLEFCRAGPVGARVDGVEAEWGAASGEFANFSTRY